MATSLWRRAAPLPIPLQAALWAVLKVFVAYFVAVRITHWLLEASGGLSLFAPAAGAAVLMVRHWGRPALAGIALAFVAANWQPGATAIPLLRHVNGTERGLALLLLAAAAALQAWIAHRLLCRYGERLATGQVERPRWLPPIGVAASACLVNVSASAWLLPRLLPAASAGDWLALALQWLAEILAVLMLTPALLIAGLRGENALTADRFDLGNPCRVMLLLALPAWLLAGSANLQQARQERTELAVRAELLGRELQAEVDAASQHLSALAAHYGNTAPASAEEFQRFTAALAVPGGAPPAVDWVAHLINAQRDSWPVLRQSALAARRQPALGLDLAASPVAAALLATARPGHLILLHAPESGNPLLLYPVGQPLAGAGAIPLRLSALLAESPQARLIGKGHSQIRLLAADGRLLAHTAAASPTAAEPESANTLHVPVRVGRQQWQLQVSTASIDLPFLRSALWWLGQLLPQGVCLGLGLLLVLEALRERSLQRLEIERAALTAIPHPQLEPAHVAAAASPSSVLARPTDALFQQAWEAGAFTPRFEPIIELASGQIRGVEALLRWPAAPKGVITPDIIEWAERKQVISELDHRMLTDSLAALSRWPLARGSAFTVSVNVSATEMQQPHWADQVIKALDASGVAGKRLCLEITEGILVRPDAHILNQLARLRSTGIKVALDDFGTGYSSIGYLRQLPVDRIKLDRIFTSGIITDPKARQIVASIINLGRSLGIEVVAEGVEDAGTAEVLLQLGCPLSQGWLFSKAASAGRVHKWLAAGAALYPDHTLGESELDLVL